MSSLYGARVNWTTFKSWVDSGIPFKEIILTGSIRLIAVDGDSKVNCIIHTDGDMPTEYADYQANYESQKNVSILDRDDSGRVVNRSAVTEKGFHYDLVFLERSTSTDSYYMKDRNGTDRGTVTITRYDDQDQVTTTDADVVKSKVVVQFNHDIEIIEAEFFQTARANQDCRLWVTAAGHIPSANGGSKPFVEGLNMKIMGEYYHIDGRSSKYIKEDTTYYSHQWELIEKHDAGYSHDYCLSIGFYKA